MPRRAREQSRTNIYHVMLRGVNRQTIFEDNEDMSVFMKELKRCKKLSDFKLYAFCLMPNHVHLLMETCREPLGIVFRRLGSSYAGWYNRKYERAGHLFQDRFRSEKVESELYFRTVLRYILQNPMKAGLERTPGTYRWSSYLAYEKGAGTLTDTGYATEMFGEKDALMDFLCGSNEDKVMDEEDYIPRPSETRAKAIMEEVAQCTTVPAFQKLERDHQKKCIREMYGRRLSIRQISRLTGKTCRTVSKYLEEQQGDGSTDAFEGSLVLNDHNMMDLTI